VALFSLQSDGNVGIGTTNPQSNLQMALSICSSASPDQCHWGGTYSNSAGANLKLKLYDDGVTANTYGLGVSSSSMDFGVQPSAGYNWYAGGSNKMSLTIAGTCPSAELSQPKYQDVAEWVPSSDRCRRHSRSSRPNKSNQVITSTQSYDTRVAGVISEQPGLLWVKAAQAKSW